MASVDFSDIDKGEQISQWNQLMKKSDTGTLQRETPKSCGSGWGRGHTP